MQDDPREDYLHALREILKELALLGLWRSRFFADRDRMSYPHCTQPCRSRPRARAACAAASEKRISWIPLSTVFR